MNKIIVLLLTFFLLVTNQIHSQNIFVDLKGNDNNPGTIDQPLSLITTAIEKIQPGDTIFVRAGVHSYSSTISVSSSKNGSEVKRYYLFGYKSERPVLDFSSMEANSSNRGINFKASFWHVKGFDFKGAGDNGMNLSGSNNIVEYCSFYENKDTGLQLSGGASNNQIINCDSYYNADLSNQNADGFAPKLDVGNNNYFYGCRAWQNSDDGWDGYLRTSPTSSTILENCWCFSNGYLKDGKASSGNGNGYKMGGGDNGNSANTAHSFTLKNCLVFDNRVKGFDQNNNKGSMTILNCTAYRNGTNYSIPLLLNENEILTISNCISLGNYGTIGSFAQQQTNSWVAPFIVAEEDFISIDTTEVRGKRKSDGSLPDIHFMHLAQGSDLIDAGTDVGLPFLGFKPDIGAFEFDNISSTAEQIEKIPETFVLEQNYPNPFNPSTIINFTVANGTNLALPKKVTLKVYDILGNEITTLVDEYKQPGKYSVKLSASDFQFSSGVYFYRLNSGSFSQTNKMVLIK